MVSVLTLCALLWGIAATCFASVQNYSGAFACRFFIGLGEAGFSPLIQVFLSRFYAREKLGTRVAVWLAMAPLGGFVNGIVAYGVSFIHASLESWRILFLIEGGATVLVAVIAIVVLPDDIASCRWFTAEEKDYCKHNCKDGLKDLQLTYSSDVRTLYEHGSRSQGDQLEASTRCIVPLATGYA